MSKAADSVDAHIGARVRMRRQMMSMSQEQLGEALGLTFQQVQKYEKGLNRIGAGRLYRIAQALQVQISFFFEGLPDPDAAEGARGEISPEKTAVMAFVSSAEGYSLSAAFSRIEDPSTRRRLVDLVRTIAQSEEV